MKDKVFDKLMEKIVNEEIIPSDSIINKLKADNEKKNLLAFSFTISIFMTLISIFLSAYLATKFQMEIKAIVIWFLSISFIFNLLTALTLVFIKKISIFLMKFETLITSK